MKNYSVESTEKALLRKGFQHNGGNSGIEYFGNEEHFNEANVCSHFIYHHNNGHSTIMATVENSFKNGKSFATINGIHPVEWFESVKNDIS